MAIMWHYDEPVDGLLHVRIDRADRPVNSFSRATLEELRDLLVHVRNEDAIQGVAFCSGQPGNFIVGADVTEMKDLDGEDAAREMSQFGQKVFDQLAALKVPTVALISGACLGGGLEFAMACKYRLADKHPKTQLGLPEVMLGLIPGWGGTVRLPKLIGLIDALPMMLTGKMLNGYQARSKGLVHDVLPNEGLERAGIQVLKSGLPKMSKRKPPLWKRIANNFGPIKKYILNKAEQRVQRQTRGHYPAPLKVIESLREQIASGTDSGYDVEAKAIAQLGQSPVTRELMRVFFLSEAAKKPPEDLTVKPDASAVTDAAVLGAGAMGAGIALLLARKNVWTRLKDINAKAVSAGLQTINGLLNKDLARKRITPLERTRTLDHLRPITDYSGLKRTDIVIEAIVENLEIKREVFRDLAEATGPDTVLATNTSSLTVSDIAEGMSRPQRIVGLHFFNPPQQMKLVEIIRTPYTNDAAIATAFATVQKLGKTGIVVGDCAGFLVNRILAPYMNEVGYLLEEVSEPLEIDRAATEFGMMMGPIKMADLVGLDIAAHVAANMHAAYGDRMKSATLWTKLGEMRAKSGGGKRLIQGTGKKKQLAPDVTEAIEQMRRSGPSGISATLSREVIIQRLIYPMINEAARCLEEGIASKPDDIDLAMVLGTGFAPFRGGPLQYADSVGIQHVCETLDKFAEKMVRMTPCAKLREMAKGNEKFSDAKVATPAA
ncbi:3-hydroxyacyl-CoA dehydrogenase NAD-binding domain-containing protein [Symmachiella dynata]|uniref:3-hydroxyacyl-CoA dehydrogenase NAD-binding domain-containing protein n=1 Tax=Symmachiella dynata TaxID=2527995 RepID=UPI0030EC08E7